MAIAWRPTATPDDCLTSPISIRSPRLLLLSPVVAGGASTDSRVCPSRNSPQKRHFRALALIVSPQNGQSLFCDFMADPLSLAAQARGNGLRLQLRFDAGAPPENGGRLPTIDATPYHRRTARCSARRHRTLILPPASRPAVQLSRRAGAVEPPAGGARRRAMGRPKNWELQLT